MIGDAVGVWRVLHFYMKSVKGPFELEFKGPFECGYKNSVKGPFEFFTISVNRPFEFVHVLNLLHEFGFVCLWNA